MQKYCDVIAVGAGTPGARNHNEMQWLLIEPPETVASLISKYSKYIPEEPLSSGVDEV